MASGSNPAMEDDELKGDGKKRKFKPLEAVRKFFGKSKRKSKDDQVSVVAVKAKSTTALHHDPDYGDDDDDDGGFKNRQPRPLGGNRSISEDSIFSPDHPKEPNLQALKKAAVSEESLPKTAFQAELFSKLNKRRSQYSDEDDGLPHSPTPPVTMADIIMGGPLKPLPAGGKSTSRESDNSLISNDLSDNDEDDPFKSQWKSAVPSKLSKKPGKSGGGSEAPIDFDNMGQTELLKSDLAKDKISIKPRARKTNRQSRKLRESQSPHGLPSLNEETGSRARADTASTSSMSEYLMDTDRQEDPGSSTGPLSSSLKFDPPTPRRSPFTKQTSEPTAPRPTSMPVFVTPSKPAPRQEKTEEDKRASVFSDIKSPSVKDDEKRVNVKPELKSLAVKDDDKRGGLKTELKSPALKEDDKRTSLSSDVKSPSGQDETPASVKSGLRSPAGKEEEKRAGSKFDFRATPSKDEGGDKGDGGKGEGEEKGKALPTSKSLESVKKESEGVSPSETAQGGSLMTRSLYSAPSSKNSEISSTTRSKVDFLSSSVKPLASTGSASSHRPAAPAEPESSPVSLPSVNTSTTKMATPADTSPSSSPSKSSSSASPGASKREGLRQTDSQVSPAFSPKDDYKLRRQSRSKTLPEHTLPKDEPFATRVQRAASHRVEATSSQNASPETSPRHKERVVEPSKSKEPEWFALARKKAGRQESEEKKEEATPVKDNGVKDSVSTVEASASSTPVSREDSVSSSVSSAVETASNMTVSSASSKFERFSEKSSDVSRQRGGSVKTSPSKTHAFANRGSSVKIQSTKTGLSLTGTSSVSDSPAPKPTPVSVKSATPSSGAKQEETKEEAKSSELSPTKELPKWKTQNVKTATPPVSSNTPVSSSTPVSSRFPNVKPSSQSTPATFTAPATKTDPKPLSSPAKKPLNKAPSEEKEKTTVPAWRANLNQKKAAPSEIKIELIESTSSGPANTSTAKKDDVAKKDNVSKKEDSPTKAPLSSKEVQSDQCRSSAATTSRTSKVMNLLKNFENVQGVS